MLKFFDNWIEKISKPILHRKRQYLIHKCLDHFNEKHQPSREVSDTLELRLNQEADRIYPIVDQSILRERIKRAKLTFFLTGVASTLTVALLGGFKTNAVLPFMTPPITAVTTWVISLLTIPISYHHRVKGAMDSTTRIYEKELAEEPSTTHIHQALEIDPSAESEHPQEAIRITIKENDTVINNTAITPLSEHNIQNVPVSSLRC